jgi:hypothetical protein
MSPDYDIEVEIQTTIDELKGINILITEKHVQGHQNKTTNIENLPNQEQLNVKANTEAKMAMSEHLRADTYTQLPSIKAMLYQNGRPITSKEKEVMRNAYGKIGIQKYTTTKEQWKHNTYATIWWIAHLRALRRLEMNDRIRIQKFINRILPTNKKLHQQDENHSSKCPSCNDIETNDHVSTCTNPRRAKIREAMFTAIEQNLSKNNTHPGIKECIIEGLRALITNDIHAIDAASLSQQPSAQMQTAIAEQNIIGWNNFYRADYPKNGKTSNNNTTIKPRHPNVTPIDGRHL